RSALGDASWRRLWPTNPGDTSVVDRAPCGATGFHGRVAEWCLGPFSRKSRPSPGESRAVMPPPMPGGDNRAMCVRGGSWYHRAPGQAPGASPSPLPPPPPGPDGKPGTPVNTTWRPMSLLERRSVAAGSQLSWVGFRIVHGPAGEETR
ncbi:MAG: hypothetical protein ACYTG4_12360, partial [Planctomycetota bacterium]